MLRRTSLIFALFVSCCVAFCIRNPNCSFRSASSSVFKSAADFAASAFLVCAIFIVTSVSRRRGGG